MTHKTDRSENLQRKKISNDKPLVQEPLIEEPLIEEPLIQEPLIQQPEQLYGKEYLADEVIILI